MKNVLFLVNKKQEYHNIENIFQMSLQEKNIEKLFVDFMG